MRLFVSLAGSSVNELKFDRGPIYIGRQAGNQVFLPDAAVSRQHAVFYTTKDGDWIIEDLASSNKTYLNDQAIHKSGLKHNDTVRIADFSITVSLEEDEDQNRRVNMEDTLVGESRIRRELHTVLRKVSAADAPPIRFPAKRVVHYFEVVSLLGAQKKLDDVFAALGDILRRQFSALNVWISLRQEANGPIVLQGGRKINTQSIERMDLAVPQSLADAMEKHQYVLIHQLPRQITARGIRSVIICPIMIDKDNYGVIYAENSTEHPHYSLPDMDYLIFVSIYAASIISKIK